jgi:hypothetical protein
MGKMVLSTRDLPKTRRATIMRRLTRATYGGREPGDISCLEHPAARTTVPEAT